ncbi:type II secretion system protein [Engelhardtia mirabilis]|uniref:Type II secretion system protein G n=1 Tax=Engelhardtia mirabilis TaxID=2528011 RepID=A0A518BQ25_9BACT|nr:Type II secretion system protein G precursor [Planctomycetes bacterium Pla133]QDV03400.1 Type II secretion system protein G precursor [Planctomycetes bacterium Pla86]
MATKTIDRAGFTLLELMAVVVILGILIGLLVTALGGAEESAKVRLTKVSMTQLSAAIDAYEREFGGYPASTLPESAGGANAVNVGIEALVASLWSNGWEGGGDLDPDELVNLDADSSKKQFTDFPDRQLFEVADQWGNPIAYFHNRDYERPQRYTVEDQETGELLDDEVRAFKNETTRRYFQHNKYQLISAGPDGRFMTPEDNITTFSRN